ncbi:MAG TPA: fibronectin type III domain-containing protein, partial [Nitrosopumilaceae archaeon]|nr:fibronectin type III domain-containing protein [Nitrosopumilaceae archaeon]
SFVTHTILDKSTQVTILGLKNGVPYGFSVIAVTADGIGPNSKIVYSTPVAPKSIPGTPAKITDLKATSGNNQVRLSWTTPSDNGSPIIGYEIQQFKRGDNFFTTIQKDSSSTSILVGGLTNGITYDFKVFAKNSVGISPESNMISSTPGVLEQNFVIPSWIKNNAKWWSEGSISDLEYVRAIEYLINQGIIRIK